MGGIAHSPLVAIACGGTGGHLFPGMAVGEALHRRGVRVLLLISPKAVDREAARSARALEVLPLEAAGLNRYRPWAFFRGLARSWRRVHARFSGDPPAAVLAMGGFTSLAPIALGRRLKVRTFLHESNAVPGRANRWLAPWVDEVFLGFPSAGERLRCPRQIVTGTPVRLGFRPADSRECRLALGLEAERPTLLVVGGSQGASPLNRLVVAALPVLRRDLPTLQFIHLTGSGDVDWVRAAYAKMRCAARVEPFWQRMDLALGAASVAISRAGASSLAELAAVQVPAVLVPYPSPADDHQRHNAQAFARAGAARLLDQTAATPAAILERVQDLVLVPSTAEAMRRVLAQWHRPEAAGQIAARVWPESRLTKESPESQDPAFPGFDSPAHDARPNVVTVRDD